MILMHEITKLLHYAGVKDVNFIRIGTCGGVGLEPGTCVVSSCGVMGTLEPVFEAIELGERRYYDAQMDASLAESLVAAAKEIDISVVSGKTLGSDDFYDD